MVLIGKGIVVIGFLVISDFNERTGINIKKSEYFLIVNKAPFFGLDAVEVGK